jgi:CRP/FNR family transcriptional regulator, cyclic AMP receptor protein
MRTRRFKRGEVVFHQGDPGDALFVVTKGAIKISLPSEAGDEAIIATVRPGDFFGELALLDEDRRTATVTATSPMELVVMTRQSFSALDQAMPKVHASVVEAIRGYR